MPAPVHGLPPEYRDHVHLPAALAALALLADSGVTLAVFSDTDAPAPTASQGLAVRPTRDPQLVEVQTSAQNLTGQDPRAWNTRRQALLAAADQVLTTAGWRVDRMIDPTRRTRRLIALHARRPEANGACACGAEIYLHNGFWIAPANEDTLLCTVGRERDHEPVSGPGAAAERPQRAVDAGKQVRITRTGPMAFHGAPEVWARAYETHILNEGTTWTPVGWLHGPTAQLLPGPALFNNIANALMDRPGTEVWRDGKVIEIWDGPTLAFRYTPAPDDVELPALLGWPGCHPDHRQHPVVSLALAVLFTDALRPAWLTRAHSDGFERVSGYLVSPYGSDAVKVHVLIEGEYRDGARRDPARREVLDACAQRLIGAGWTIRSGTDFILSRQPAS